VGHLVFLMGTPDSLFTPVPIGLAFLAILAVVGIAKKSPRAHAVIVVFALSVQVLAPGAAMFQADTF